MSPLQRDSLYGVIGIFTCSLDFLSLCFMWMSEVAMKVWMRGNCAGATAFAHIWRPKQKGGKKVTYVRCPINSSGGLIVASEQDKPDRLDQPKWCPPGYFTERVKTREFARKQDIRQKELSRDKTNMVRKLFPKRGEGNKKTTSPKAFRCPASNYLLQAIVKSVQQCAQDE